MPTKTKKPTDRMAELEERLRGLEHQRQHAVDAITLAKQRAEEIAARQQQLAVAVVAEDAEAVTENDDLEEALLIEHQRLTTAHSEHPLDRTLNNWLSVRLGGAGGYLDLSVMPATERIPDPLDGFNATRDYLQQEQGEALQQWATHHIRQGSHTPRHSQRARGQSQAAARSGGVGR